MKLHRLAAAISLLFVVHAADAAALRAARALAVEPDALTDARVADPHRLLLRGGLIDPAAERIDYAATGAAADVTHGRYALVQFDAGDGDARAWLAQRGYRVVGYVPNRAYVVELADAVAFGELRDAARVRWAGWYQPGMKLDPALYADRRDALATSPRGGYDIVLYGFAGTTVDSLAAVVAKTPGATTIVAADHATLPSVRVNVPKAGLATLVRTATAADAVAYVAHYLQPELYNAASVATIQGNSTNTGASGSGAVGTPTPLWDHGIFGSGQVIAVSDSGVDANEAWFVALDKGAGAVTAITPSSSPVPPATGAMFPDNKILAYWVQPGATANDNDLACTPQSSPTGYHGTHVSGTLAGDAAGTFGATTYLASTPTAANHERADGMAPNAQILMQDIGNDTNGCLAGGAINLMFAQTVAGGAYIHNASWGAASGGAYGSNDIEADRGLRDNEDLLFVVAAGNSGPGTGTTGSPANAKNALTVAALGHAGSTSIASFSSRGPTDDGRRKPDIAAPGVDIVSANGDSSTTATIEAPDQRAESGTSMASPTIAGNAVLVRQFFADGWYPRGVKTAADAYNPSGMAMKAVLLNGTNAISATNWNSNTHGWGRAWLDSNLWFANTMAGGNDARRLRLFERTNAAGLATGEQHEYAIANVAAGQELRATLTWYDAPGLAAAAIALANDLDLEVTGPGGTLYRGNVFASGVSTTGGTADARNTVEQVRLTAPAAGSYTFRVIGRNVPGDAGGNGAASLRQGYALAVSGAFGLPDPAVFPAPAPTSATTVGNTTQIAFTAAAGAQGFQLYRANGSCASARPGDFRLVATGTASPLVDGAVYGGYAYAYKLRGISGDVEGDVSTCIELTSTAACPLPPSFNRASAAVVQTQGTSCGVGLAWQAGATNCPAQPLGYRITRDTNLAFTAPTTLVANHPTPSYTDTDVAFAVPYYYRVEAVDSAGNASAASPVMVGTPVGADGLDGATWRDNAETSVYALMALPWHLSTAQATTAGGRSYFAGIEGSTYPANACASITTPDLLVRPGAVLSFKARYDLEHEWDGLVMEISTDGGATWADLPPDGGYPSSFAQTVDNNACGFPNTQGAFSGVTTTSSNADPGNGTASAVFKPFTRSLAAYSGQKVRIRWRLSSDGGAEFEGAYLDDISLGGTVFDRLFADGFDAASPRPCD
jgi:hypothetical protein